MKGGGHEILDVHLGQMAAGFGLATVYTQMRATIDDSCMMGSMKNIGKTLSAVACMALAVSSDAAGPNELPELGDASSSIVSPAMERQIGEDFLRQVHSAVPTVSDPLLKYYVASHIYDLTQHSELKETVLQPVLIDSNQINAFAAPGGIVGINLGLMTHAEDVHEYSAVIAHELAHLSQRHFARGLEEQRRNSIPTIAAMIAAILVGVAGGGDAGLAAISGVQAAAQSNALRYSRGREQEADRIGLNTMVRANLDPAGMSRMFERMHRSYRFTRTPPEFLLTHPLTESRISDARSQAMGLPKKAYVASDDYRMMRARALIHYSESPDDTVKTYRKMQRDHPDDPAAAYGYALALANAGQADEGLVEFASILRTDPNKILYIATQADLLNEAKQHDKAAALLSHHLVINPDNAPLSSLYAKVLTDQRRYDDAMAVLTRQSQVHPYDVDVWYELAEVSGLASDIVAVHRARAEFFALHGNYQKAIQHLRYARGLVGAGSTKMLARLDARITDFRDAILSRT